MRLFIERLRQEARETVDLAILNRDRVFFGYRVSAPHRLRAHYANGNALLAGLTEVSDALGADGSAGG